MQTEYQEAYNLGRLLANSGFNLVNGAGKGLMEASAKGMVDGGGKVVEEKNASQIDELYKIE